MKHIFKKLHHNPNRSNETPQQSSTTSSSSSSSSSLSSSSSSSSSSSCSVSDQRTAPLGQNSGGSPVSPSTTSASSQTVAPVSSPVPTRLQQQDYFTSEEEYQVQLALALSASDSSGQDSNMIDVNNNRRQIGQRDDADADSQSRQYWDYGVLDYLETIKDGFYDVYCKNAESKEMPSLIDLETNTEGSDFEVVVVNCKIDPGLVELMDVAQCIAIDFPATEINLLVQRLAELVTGQMGGPVRDANVLKARWMERSSELRTSRHTTVLPIGALQIGLTRHRALLFKVLADKVGIPCRVLRGRHYVGSEEDAVNVIKLPNESEFLVDLMGEPGTLIPADSQSTKDASFKTYHPKLSKFPNIQAVNDSRATYSKLTPLSGHNSGDGISLSKESEKVESLPSISGGTASVDVSPSVFSKKVAPANQIGHTPSLAIGSSLYKGGRGPNIVGDGARVNVNPVPYNQNNSEDPKYLFAELNPFQIKGSGRASLPGNYAGKKVDESQQVKDKLVTGRSPGPLLWKNPHIYNEVSKKNEYDFVESLFPKNTAASHNVSSLPSTSSITPGKASLQVFDLPNKSDDAYGGNSRNASAGNISLIGSAEVALNRVSLEDKQSIHQRETDSWDWEILQNDESHLKNDHGKNVNSTYDHINNKQFGFVGTNLKLTDQVNTSSPAELHIDPVIDDVSDCEIPWEDLVIGERIGLGSYGEVYHADWNGTEVAVKKFLDQDFSGAALAEFKREVRIMQRLRHPNVVLFMGAVTRPPNLSIITEFLPRGSLYRIIHRPHCQIDEKRRIKMALDVAKGMNCLHTSLPTIVHRDLKSPNLLVDNNWNVKVCDFGLSRLKHNTFLSSKSTAGTPEWMAPEVLRNEPSNEKCDVYSFGIILWELATLKLPWSGMNPMQVVGAVGFQNRRLDIPKEVDPLVGRIIWECWQTDPNLRPSFAQLTVALKSLQRLVIPSHIDQPSPPLQQEISVNSTP